MVRRGSVVNQRVEEKHAARRKRHGDTVLRRHVFIGNLAVALMDMRHGTGVLRTRQNKHTTVVHGCRVERDPNTDHRVCRVPIEIRKVLMPRFFRPDERGLDQRHVLNHARFFAHDSLQHTQDCGMLAHGA